MTISPTAAPLLVSGTVGIDSVFTPAGHAERVLGGSCTYFAAAARFFTPVRVVAVVGDDIPAPMLGTLRAMAGVDLAGLEVRRGGKTFAWAARYTPDMNGRETLSTELGVMLEDAAPMPAAFKGSRFVFLANMHPARQRAMLESLSAPEGGKRLVVADTMDLWIKTAKSDLLVLLRHVDGLVLNYDEALELTGKVNTVAAARAALELGPRFVVVKKGEHGCVLAHREGGTGRLAGLASLPAFPSDTVVDPTGAGDSFAGGMMGSLAAGGAGGSGAARGNATDSGSFDPGSFESVRRALIAGTVVASFTIEAFSLGRLTTLTRAEIDTRTGEYLGMVRG